MTQRNTAQRRLVLQAVRQLDTHPTADEIFAHLRQGGSGLGRATVYRNLNVLCAQGLVRRVRLTDAPDRFDFTLRPHYHLRCRRCGCFTDVFLPLPDKLDRAVARQTGFAAVEHDIVFTGVCARCQADNGEQP